MKSRVSQLMSRLLAQAARTSLMVAVMAAPAFAQTGSTSGLALDVMLQNFVANISSPIEHAVLVGSFIFGIYLLVKALFKCIKYSDEGSKGQQKFSGIWGTFMFGAMLLALPGAMTTMGMTLFGTDQGFSSFTPLVYQNPSTTNINSHINNVIATILVFLQVIGIISFTRGLSILRSVTDGNTQVTSMAGLTHVIAGAIAWNFGGFVNTISDTIGMNIMTMGSS